PRRGVPLAGRRAGVRSAIGVAGEQEAAVTQGLGAVEGAVRGPQQFCSVAAVARYQRDADAGADADLAAADSYRRPDGQRDVARDFGDLGPRATDAQQQRELVAADTGTDVAFAGVFGQPGRQLAQQLVAGCVPEAVVDALEVVEVEIEQGSGTLQPVEPLEPL